MYRTLSKFPTLIRADGDCILPHAAQRRRVLTCIGTTLTRAKIEGDRLIAFPYERVCQVF